MNTKNTHNRQDTRTDRGPASNERDFTYVNTYDTKATESEKQEMCSKLGTKTMDKEVTDIDMSLSRNRQSNQKETQGFIMTLRYTQKKTVTTQEAETQDENRIKLLWKCKQNKTHERVRLVTGFQRNVNGVDFSLHVHSIVKIKVIYKAS